VAIPTLAKLLDHPSPTTRALAMHAIGKIGTDSHALLSVLKEKVKRPENQKKSVDVKNKSWNNGIENVEFVKYRVSLFGYAAIRKIEEAIINRKEKGKKSKPEKNRDIQDTVGNRDG
jgi:hypothetical protein